ncbi:MAG: TAXI family TRAP transporter solute-binding subunit [Bacillota bacterium]
MKKISYLLVVILILSVSVLGCTSNEADEDSSTSENGVDDQFVTILTGGSSGPYFALGGALSNLINQNLDYANSSVESTGASAVNSTKIGNNEAELAFAMNNVVSFAYEGVESFKDKNEFSNLRGITSLYPNYVQVITTKDTGLTQIEDLKGKRVGVGAPGSGTEVDARNILATHDITYDDLKEDYLPYSESVEQLKNGKIDAAFLTSGLPNSTIMDLATTHDVQIITIRPEMAEKLQKRVSFYSSEVIPAGTYDNEEDIYTAAVKTILITNDKLDEQVAYDVTKTLYENLDTMKGTHSAANHIDIEKFNEGMPIPLHPGAKRFYQEKGVLE